MDREAVSFSFNHVTEGRSSHARAVKDATLQNNRKHKGPSETQKNETIEEKSIRKRTENVPRNCTSKTRTERVRYQEGEGGSRREH